MIQLSAMAGVYSHWNSMINVISRKDMENFNIHHLLHSLSIAKFISFLPGTTILDVGTGGGFPGIPLAVLFPECEFTLLDSIEKKIKVADAVKEELGLPNVRTRRLRAEEETGKYDFVVSRAVMRFHEFVDLTGKNLKKKNNNSIPNGILYLKGGDLGEELQLYMQKVKIIEISHYFGEAFFETKKIVYLPV